MASSSSHRTLNVNLYAGPGIGKSVTAARLYAELKLRGIHTELVSEYAKELVYTGELATATQEQIMAEQLRRQGLLQGVTRVVVTDSPCPMSLVYARRLCPDKKAVRALENKLRQATMSWVNLDVLLHRDLFKSYETEGRAQTPAEALVLHSQIGQFLREFSPEHLELQVETALESLCELVQAHLQVDGVARRLAATA